MYACIGYIVVEVVYEQYVIALSVDFRLHNC